jgi:hypothetical protein
MRPPTERDHCQAKLLRRYGVKNRSGYQRNRKEIQHSALGEDDEEGEANLGQSFPGHERRTELGVPFGEGRCPST